MDPFRIPSTTAPSTAPSMTFPASSPPSATVPPQQPAERHRRTIDAALALALFACSFPGSLITWPGQSLGVPWWPGVMLAGVSCVALLLRRSGPRTTVALTLACATVACALGYLLTVLLLAPLMVALHSLALRTDRRTANCFTLTGIALLIATGLVAGPDGEPLVLKLIGPTAWLLLPTSLGTATRLRGAYLEAVHARAEHAERTRDEEAKRRVAEERMRIARDLHDVVAHHLVLANLQAGAVGRFVRDRPEEAERLIAELTGTTSSALRELKATVGLLRAADDNDRPVDATPGIARLPELAASFENAGLKVTVSTTGEPRPLPAGADLTAYRIVQEALTNVTKHAATRTAEVHLAYTPELLRLTVTNHTGHTGHTGDTGDTGAMRATGSTGSTDCTGTATPPAPSPGSGYGLIGMRERAHSAGGRLRVGPRPYGGFEVVAELPLSC